MIWGWWPPACLCSLKSVTRGNRTRLLRDTNDTPGILRTDFFNRKCGGTSWLSVSIQPLRTFINVTSVDGTALNEWR